MSTPQVGSPRVPTQQLPIQSSGKYATTSEDEAHGFHRGGGGRGRGIGRGRGGRDPGPSFQREAMDNRRRAEAPAWGRVGGDGGRDSRAPRDPDGMNRIPPRRVRGPPTPRNEDGRRPDVPRAPQQQQQEQFEDAPWIKAHREAQKRKQEQARWVNSGSNGTRIYNVNSEPPMDWDDCEGAKKWRSITKWVDKTEKMQEISKEQLLGLDGLPIPKDFELEDSSVEFLVLTDATGKQIDNTPHRSDGTPRLTSRPPRNIATPGILDIGSLSINAKPRDGVKYIRGGARGGDGNRRGAPRQVPYGGELDLPQVARGPRGRP